MDLIDNPRAMVSTQCLGFIRDRRFDITYLTLRLASLVVSMMIPHSLAGPLIHREIIIYADVIIVMHKRRCISYSNFDRVPSHRVYLPRTVHATFSVLVCYGRGQSTLSQAAATEPRPETLPVSVRAL